MRIEITTYENTDNTIFAETLFKQPIEINGITLRNRKLMDIVKVPVTKVTIFEALFEQDNHDIFYKLKQYGDLQQKKS